MPIRPDTSNPDPVALEELSALMARLMGQPYWGWVRDVVSKLGELDEMSPDQIRAEAEHILGAHRNQPQHELIYLAIEAALIWLRNENGKPGPR